MRLKSLSQLGTVGATTPRVAMRVALGFASRCSDWPGSQEPKSGQNHRRGMEQGDLLPIL